MWNLNPAFRRRSFRRGEADARINPVYSFILAFFICMVVGVYQMKKGKTNTSGCKKEETRKAKTRFWRKFLRLTRGRVPVLKALSTAAGEEENAELKKNLRDILVAMETGSIMSEALAKCDGYFSASIIELIRSAEQTAAWDEILPEIADGIEEGTFD